MPINVCDETEIKNLLGRHGFHFSKSMGQNFLIQEWVPRDIAQASGANQDCGVLEIGPGIGPLTRQLSCRAAKVTAVELDHSLLPLLSETLEGCDNVNVIFDDILKMDIPALAREEFPGLTPLVCANLPYNITTPVLTALLDARCFQSITVMIQREVARRICAQAGSPDYGAFSIYCQYYARCELLFDVPPSCFLPAPKVTSTVLQLTPWETPPVSVSDEKMFFRVVKAAFAMRRKTLVNGLFSVFGQQLSKERLAQLLVSCGLSASVRGERLGLEEFARLSDRLKEALEL